MSFYVETESLGEGALLIAPHGNIDNSSFEIVEHAFKQAYSDNVTRILVDLDKVPRISSVGIGVLISCQTHLASKSTGKLVLLSPQEDVVKIFEVMDYLDVFEIVDTKEDALKALNSA